MKYFIAVHTGAGYSSNDTNSKFRKLCKTACAHAAELLRYGGTANEAAVAATLLLEKSAYTNAGVGSSISKDKNIQTEASICSTLSGFHCVGALNNIEHPIRIAGFMSWYSSCEHGISKEYIPPRFLVGQGAIDYYLEDSANTVEELGDTNLFTKESIKRFHRARSYFNDEKIHKKRKGNENKHQNSELDKKRIISATDKRIISATDKRIISATDKNVEAAQQNDDTAASRGSYVLEGVEDTVGVVCVDSNGMMVCTTSSGGSIYKYNGRLGQCCVHGAGSYIQGNTGLVTTGNGEQIINTLLAIKLTHNLPHTQPQNLLQHTLDANLRASDSRMSGFMMLSTGEDDVVSINVQHSLKNMVFGYQASSMSTPAARILSKSDSSSVAVFIESMRL